MLMTDDLNMLFAAPLASTDENGPAPRDIRWLQDALNKVMNADLKVDGVPGTATRAALRAFQAAHGLKSDGVAGPQTRDALHRLLFDAAPVAPLIAAPCTGLPVRQVLDRFAFGQHRLEPHHQPKIDAIAACLLSSLASPTPIDGLSLIGHTDPVGSDAANTTLGQRRAEAVADAIEASLRRQAGRQRFSFVFTPSSRGEQSLLPGDPGLSRRVEVIAPFAFPPRRPDPQPQPFRSDLDPPRWGPILARAIGPHATIRAGNAVRHLVDAENPGQPLLAGYDAIVQAIRATRGNDAFIYILGWICVDDVDMITCDPASTLRQLLRDAASRGVQVRALFWEQPIILPDNRRKTQKTADQINALPGGAAIIDAETLSLGAHHQKLIVVGQPEGGMIGFTGGLDVNSDRILPSTVVCPRPPATMLAADDESLSGGGGDPLHDVHCRVEGPATFDMLQTFIQRWDHHPASRRIEAVAPLRGRRVAPPTAIPTPIAPTRGSVPGSCSVVIGRTFNPRKGSGMARERDIKSMLLAAIGRARRFIYIEDQYLINLDAARALRAALPNIAHLTIVISASDINSDTPCIWTYRREFIDLISVGLTPDLAAKLRVFQLVSPPVPAVPPPCSTRGRSLTPVFGRHTYVHAKCWVFDDELSVIGSANCNKRGWEHDSEIGAFVFDDRAPTAASSRTFAQKMRMDLWSEHLSLPPATFADGITSASHWLRPPARGHVLRYCPLDGHDIGEFKCDFIRDTVVDPPAP